MALQSEARFSEFVRRQQERQADTRQVDWEAEKQQWLGYLDQLYVEIRGYLGEYIEQGSVRLESSSFMLHEDKIGAYPATLMTVIIGDQAVVLRPVGTLLVGSKGRVDVEGIAGTSRLVLMDEDIRHIGQMISVETHSVATDMPAASKVREPARKRSTTISWVWKIISRPPERFFIPLTKESFFQMILEVSSG